MSKPKKSEIALRLASRLRDVLDELAERSAALEEAVFGDFEEEVDLDYCEQCNDCHGDLDDDVDPVSHPSHYADDPSGVECIEITQHMNFNLGNAFKYLFRAGHKGDKLEDLQKALWYVNHQREMLEEGWGIPPSFPLMGSNPTVATYMNFRWDVSVDLWDQEEGGDLVPMQYDEITDAMLNIIDLSGNTLSPKATLEKIVTSIEWAIEAQSELEAE